MKKKPPAKKKPARVTELAVKSGTTIPVQADPLARLNALREQLLDTAFGVGRHTRERIVNKLLEIAEGTESEGNAINAGFALAEFDRTGIAAAKIVFDGVAAAAGVNSNNGYTGPGLSKIEIDEVVTAMLGPGQAEPEDEQVVIINGFKKEETA